METNRRSTSLQSTQPPATTHRRIILFPLPFQGHINPMLQLANILETKGGFKITIIHTQYNSPNCSNYPNFAFKSIPDGFSKIAHLLPSGNLTPEYFLSYVNESCVEAFRGCVDGLLGEEEGVACLITDALWYFTQAVADAVNLPRLVLWTSSLAWNLVYAGLPLFLEKGYFNLTKKDSVYELLVPEFPQLKFKDILKITTNPHDMCDLMIKMIRGMKASSGLIWNTYKELEQPSLEAIHQKFPIPSFTLGPFHKYFPASSNSLYEQDRKILSWLDTQTPKSVIYISFGSIAHITESEFQEMAHGLTNAGFPFLWVVRLGLVRGSEWLELLPKNFLESLGERGRIVKWSPQQEVLAHTATGCFWTHNGWNSTLESISEGIPMICSPFFVDQPLIARYVSDVWKIGIFLEDGLERVGIERAITKLMSNNEGEEIRKRVSCLKQKVNLSLYEDGSSRRSLENLVNHISLF